MPAERAGYTVTMFLVDVSPSMGKMREVEVPATVEGAEPQVVEMTNLEWSLQFVKLKIQEMIFNGRKTDQCGVILFGTEDTDNIVNDKNGGYEHVTDFIPIAKPDAGTLAKLSALEPSEVSGDPIDALIVGIETQHIYLSSKKTWTRKIVILTDGESPIEIEDWEATVRKMNALDVALTVVGVDFDDDELPFHEEDKSDIKRANETFYHTLISKLNTGVVGNCDFALQELARPEIRQTKSALLGTVLRVGDVDARPHEAIEIVLKSSKCTALVRPKSWKKFAERLPKDGEADTDEDERENRATEFVQLQMRTEFYIDRVGASGSDAASTTGKANGERASSAGATLPEKIEKEELIRGFKYGSSFAPCPDGQFPKLPTRRGIDICGFFLEKHFRRDYAMGEVTYLWADPSSGKEQVALSAIVQAMYEKGALAIARWVSRDGADPKMGVLKPCIAESVDYFLWVQMPFADDVRNFPFASLETLVSKTGEVVKKHPYLPTEEQMEAMDNFVDAMDLMDAGEKDEDGNRQPWFDTRLSYNPAIHRTKQALFHGAIVPDLNTHPLPPPHPELTKYFRPPKRVLKRAASAIEECKEAFKVKEVPKRVIRARKDGHVPAHDEDDEMLLLDSMTQKSESQAQSRIRSRSQIMGAASTTSLPRPKRETQKMRDENSETEPESDDEPEMLPTPRSPSPRYDSGRAPGRIVGSAYPLKDFKDNLARGDVVTKAAEDLCAVIKEIVVKPFANRRADEMIECMRELRNVALEEDEIETWNNFLPELRTACLKDMPGNKEFWARVQKLGPEISLITAKEARPRGGKSDISDVYAAEFLQ